MRGSPTFFSPKGETNESIGENIYQQFIEINWVSSPQPFISKMAFYIEQFLQIIDGLIVCLDYLQQHWSYGHRIPIGHLRVHSLVMSRLGTDPQIQQVDNICQLCFLQKVDMEHFIFRQLVCYDIRGNSVSYREIQEGQFIPSFITQTRHV